MISNHLLLTNSSIVCPFVLQRSPSRVNVDNFKIFTTPRKLIRSLQNKDDVNSNFSEKQSKWLRSPSSKFDWTPTTKYNQNGFQHEVNYEVEGTENLSGCGEQVQIGSESVSSTEDVPADVDVEVSHEMLTGSKIEIPKSSIKKSYRRIAFKLVCSLFMLLALLASLLWIGDRDEGYNIVPT